MRAAGGYPKYPIPPAAARVRLQHLVTRIERIELELARSATAERWAERDGWAEERDALADALALLEAIPTLPRCGCGKIVHDSPAEAERHIRLLYLVNDRPSPGLLGIYGDCPVRRHPGWHVGHRTHEPRG